MILYINIYLIYTLYIYIYIYIIRLPIVDESLIEYEYEDISLIIFPKRCIAILHSISEFGWLQMIKRTK
jgi:hypothetical protein